MLGKALHEKPRWLRDLVRFLPLKSQFVLSGNVHDLQACELAPGVVTPQPLVDMLGHELRRAGYAHVFVYDPLVGFRALCSPGDATEASINRLREFGLTVVNDQAVAGVDLLATVLQRLIVSEREPVALLVNFASRLAMRVESLSAV